MIKTIALGAFLMVILAFSFALSLAIFNALAVNACRDTYATENEMAQWRNYAVTLEKRVTLLEQKRSAATWEAVP